MMNIKKAMRISILLVTVAFVTSCISPRNDTIVTQPDKPELADEQRIVRETAEGLGDTAENIKESADSIDRHADEIRANTPPENLPVISPSLDGIDLETDELRDAKSQLLVYEQRLEDVDAELAEEQEKVEDWVEYASNNEAEIQSLQAKIVELKDESARQFKKMMTLIGGICVAGIGICIVLAIWLRSGVAFMVALGFGATLAVSLAVTLYMQTIALITIIVFGVAFAGVLAYFGWHFYLSKKTEEELVHTGEIAKQYLSEEDRERLFGYGAEPGTISLIQNKNTKRRVKQIRKINEKNRLGKMAPRMPDNYRSNKRKNNSAINSGYNRVNENEFFITESEEDAVI